MPQSVSCLVQAPEICVEVLSPSNTPEEISEKIALYFESGHERFGSASTALSSLASPPSRKFADRPRCVLSFRHTSTFEPGLARKGMEAYGDDLSRFEAEGAVLLPVINVQGYGARIWYATYGSGSPVILLHGGLGHSGNWGFDSTSCLRFNLATLQ